MSAMGADSEVGAHGQRRAPLWEAAARPELRVVPSSHARQGIDFEKLHRPPAQGSRPSWTGVASQCNLRWVTCLGPPQRTQPPLP